MNKSYVCKCSDINSVQYKYGFPVNTLSNDQVYIWIAEAAHWIHYSHRFEQILSAGELAKANTFRFKKDHDLYIIAHGLLRLILSEYNSIAPENLLFHHTSRGKPYLADVGPKCYFNLSHTTDLIAIAVNWLDEIGIDIEKIQTDFSWKDIAQHYFNPDEIACLERLDNAEATKLFFTYWTRKESFLKATGSGLIDDIKSLAVPAATNSFSLVSDGITQSVRQNWSIVSFPVFGSHIGSIAFSPEVQHIHFFQASQLLHRL